jgi:NAD(P)-dependent dehydrogenase (short-subunit alcohol dehydrogenase family)
MAGSPFADSQNLAEQNRPSHGSLGGRTLLVTGASSGIGRATAVLLSQLGAKLIISGQDPERLQLTMRSLSGGGHIVAPFNLSEVESISGWIKDLANQHGALSGLAHCAGIHTIGPLQTLQVPKVETVLRVNVTSAIFLVKAFRQKGCAAAGASLVLVSSVAGLTGQPALTVYSTSKGALIAFARSAAVELAPAGIRVNCVAPGIVETEMTGRLREQLTDEQFQAIEHIHPLGLGSPADVASAIAFLIGPQSRWITGTTIVVDGGYSAL